MDETKAGIIFDYIQSNQDTPYELIAQELEITKDTAVHYSVLWAAYSKDIFIEKLISEVHV